MLIGQSVDKLGDEFRPALRTGGLSNIRRTYPEDAPDDACPAVREEEFSPIESMLLPAARSNDPPRWMMRLACFLE